MTGDAPRSSERVLNFINKMTLYDADSENSTFFYCQPCNCFFLSTDIWLAHVTGNDHRKCIVRWRQCQDLNNEQLVTGGTLQKFLVEKNVVGLDYVVEISKLNSDPHHFVCILCSFVTDDTTELLDHLLSFTHKDQIIKTSKNTLQPPSLGDCDPTNHYAVVTEKMKQAVDDICTSLLSLSKNGVIRTYVGGWLQDWSENKEREEEETCLLKSKTNEIINNLTAFELDQTLGPLSRCVANSDYTNFQQNVIGLQYLIEFWLPNRRIIPVFYCVLCDLLTVDWKEHWTSFRHVVLYLEKHYKNIYESVVVESIDETNVLENCFRACSMVLHLEGRNARAGFVCQLKMHSFESFLPLNVSIIRRLVEILLTKKMFKISPPPIVEEILSAKNEDLTPFLEKLVSDSCAEIVKKEENSTSASKDTKSCVDCAEITSNDLSTSYKSTSKNSSNKISLDKSDGPSSNKPSNDQPTTDLPSERRKRRRTRIKRGGTKPSSNGRKPMTSNIDDKKNEKTNSKNCQKSLEKEKITKLSTIEIMERAEGRYPRKSSPKSQIKKLSTSEIAERERFVKNLYSSSSAKNESVSKVKTFSSNVIVDRSSNQKGGIKYVDTRRSSGSNKITARSSNYRKEAEKYFESWTDVDYRKRKRTHDRKRKADEIIASKKNKLNAIKTDAVQTKSEQKFETTSEVQVVTNYFLSDSNLETLTNIFRDVGVDFGRRLTMDDVDTIRQSVGSETCDRLLETYLKNPNLPNRKESSQNSCHPIAVPVPSVQSAQIRPDIADSSFIGQRPFTEPETFRWMPHPTQITPQNIHNQSQIYFTSNLAETKIRLPTPSGYPTQIVGQPSSIDSQQFLNKPSEVASQPSQMMHNPFAKMGMASTPVYRDAAGQMFLIARHPLEPGSKPTTFAAGPQMYPNRNLIRPQRFY